MVPFKIKRSNDSKAYIQCSEYALFDMYSLGGPLDAGYPFLLVLMCMIWVVFSKLNDCFF